MREEPHSHHVALPWQVLLAVLPTALVWGWLRVAGVVALSWGGVLRIGEVLAARPSDLLLPSEVHHTTSTAFLAVAEPKTRFKAARHQSAKLDQPDLLRVIQLAFQHLTVLIAKNGKKAWTLVEQSYDGDIHPRNRCRPIRA